MNVPSIDEDCRRRFEAAWLDGAPLPIDQCLPPPGEAEWLPTLEELVAIELEFGWQTRPANGPVLETYFDRYPLLQQAPIARRLIQQEYAVRHELGDRPARTNYQERFPQWAADCDLGSEFSAPSAARADYHAREFSSPVSNMAVALETFVKQLTDSGVITPGKLQNFIPPRAAPKDSQELARLLVRSKCLTKFQAQEIYQNRAISLILGNYTILDKIGAGGMGQVFKAQHRRMDRTVAIKMLPKNMLKDAPTVARFEREVRAAAKLEHPNIVTAYDADQAGKVHFLVMQYVDGQDLFALVATSGPLPVSKAVNYILQVAKGLEFAHKKGVIHRDIKPSNLLVDNEGTVKILDMGLARIEADEDAGTQAELTGTGAVMGTADYMAPEQALSTRGADVRADVYSLGCTLHYLITGKAPYEGKTLMEKFLAHREQPIPSLGTDVSPQLQTAFDKMVAKKVEKRYQTMVEVVAALEQCGSGAQSPPGLQQSVGTTSNRDGATFVLDAPARTIHNAKPEPAKKSPSSKPFNDRKKFIWGAVGAGILGLLSLAGIMFKMQTKDGTLVVEINQPDAIVQVLDVDGKIEVSQPGGKGSIRISVDPGKHRLKVEKDGFQFYAKDFEMEAGGTQSIKATLEPVKAVENAGRLAKSWGKPAFQKWMKEVAALPPEKQVEPVVKKLRELNPGFNGDVKGPLGQGPPVVQDGVISWLEFLTENVTDISPLRALTDLRVLNVEGSSIEGSSEGSGMLSDLSPLKGLPLTGLTCRWTQVTDLSPLKGMPLTSLNIQFLGVTDLSPLQGMKLDHLFCSVGKVADLSPLKGMPLEHLQIEATQVADLSPLEGMPLIVLNVSSTLVSDLSPLKGMPLETLGIRSTNVSDLSSLKGLPLVDLDFATTRVADLTPLTGMKLTKVAMENTQVSDLSPLEGMKLTELYFTPKNVTKGIDVIRRMATIEKIGIGLFDPLPPAEFWKKYDAGEFNQ